MTFIMRQYFRRGLCTSILKRYSFLYFAGSVQDEINQWTGNTASHLHSTMALHSGYHRPRVYSSVQNDCKPFFWKKKQSQKRFVSSSYLFISVSFMFWLFNFNWIFLQPSFFLFPHFPFYHVLYLSASYHFFFRISRGQTSIIFTEINLTALSVLSIY